MPRSFRRSICWLRRDLRLRDNAALAAATAESESVVIAFVFDTRILDELPDRDDRRVTFIYESLSELDRELRERDSHLVVLHGDPAIEIPALARSFEAEAVFAARDYEPYARARDEAVERTLTHRGAKFRSVKDSVIFEGGEVLTQSRSPFRVYTPYAHAWRRTFREHHAAEHLPDLSRLVATEFSRLEDYPLSRLGFSPASLWLPAGERAAQARLTSFRSRLRLYKTARNFPADEMTSGLSVHLRFGTLSIRECVRAARESGPDGEAWLSELIWRDFFQDVLFHHPDVAERPFQARYAGLDYPGEPSHFEAWCQGQTGYPIVDAAMRCLNETGWMHNRLRMIVASFLTKDLLCDYRKGEAYFARKLLDFDLASNNGNWQWAASTGCDAQPYFRIFNPTAQSEKFDPEGVFIRRWAPELAALSAPAIHAPSEASALELIAADVVLGENYPLPIVDHSNQRQRAIDLLGSRRDVPGPQDLPDFVPVAPQSDENTL